MLTNPQLQYEIACRRQQELQARAKVEQELRATGVGGSARDTSAAFLRWLADRVDEPVRAPGYRPNA
jgi:hypothetical protein